MISQGTDFRRLYLCVVAMVCLGMCGSDTADAESGKWLLDADWPKDHGLVGNEWTEDLIISARLELLHIGPGEGNYSVPESKVGDFNGDGSDDLIALINSQCTGDPYEVFLVFSRKVGWVAQSLPTHQASMDRTLIDLDEDGTFEVLTSRSMHTEGVGHVSSLEWTAVNSWSEDGFSDNSAAYLETFYVGRYLETVSKYVQKARDQLEWALKEQPIERREVDVKEGLGMLELAREALQMVSELRNGTPGGK